LQSTRYHLAKQARESFAKPDTFADGIPLLLKAMAKKDEIDQYIQWMMKYGGFYWQNFGSWRIVYNLGIGGDDSPDAYVAQCQMLASQGLSDQIFVGIKAVGDKPVTTNDVTTITDQVLTRAFAKLEAGNARKMALQQIGPNARKIMVCNRTPAPKLDGKLDDPCWKNVPVYGGFFKLKSAEPADFPTEFQMVHDGETLYVAVRCFQSTDVLLTWTQGHDDQIWKEDGIEFLLNKPSDTSTNQRHQLCINTKGVFFDFFAGSAKWNGTTQIAITLEPDCYIMEFSVPLKEINIDPARDRYLRVNLVRNVFGRKELGKQDKDQAAKEISNWFYTALSNIDPMSRGWLIFNP